MGVRLLFCFGGEMRNRVFVSCFSFLCTVTCASGI